MAFKTISGTVELTTGAYTPSETSPVYQLENGATLLSLDLENDGSPYTLTGSESAYVKMYFTANNTETAYVLMDKATGNISVELTNVLTAIAGQAVAFIKITGSDDALLFSCKIPIPILRTSGTAVTSYEEPAAGTVAYLEGLIDNKQDLLTTGGVVQDDGAGNATEKPVGIANDNLVEMDDTDAESGDYLRLTANGAQGRSADEVAVDIGVSNKNILHNWDFRTFPVNQRASSGDITSGYFYDRWLWQAGTITIATGYLSLPASTAMEQRIENTNLANKTVAIGVMIGGTVYQGTGTFPSTFGTANVTITGFGTATLGYVDSSPDYMYLRLTAADSTRQVQAVKLEIGTISTLANDPPADYGEQLAICNRYYQLCGGASIVNTLSATYVSMFAVFPVEMRTSPTISLVASSLVIYDGGDKSFESLSLAGGDVTAKRIGYMVVQGSINGGGSWSALFLKCNTFPVFSASADL